MIILTHDPVWQSEDAQKLKEFLDTQTGNRMLSNLAAQIPSLLDGSHVNKTLVTSGEVKGWTDTLQAIFSLLTIQPPQPKPVDNYPPIDDDAYWVNHEKPTE